MRIAIIGAGVSGLVAAHVLKRAYDVTVFDARAKAGGHANTVRIDTPYETHHVDTGFIVYNEPNYPNFTRLLAALGVATQPSTMTFSVHDAMGRFEYSTTLPRGLYATSSHLLRPSFQRMLADYLRFRHAAHRFLRDARSGDVRAMSDFIEESRFSRMFVERLLVPLGASIWSADRTRFLDFPARYVLAFFNNHGLINTRGRPRWRTVSGGSDRYVEAMVRQLGDRMRVQQPVERVKRREHDVVVRLRGGHEMEFDRVVMATHSDQTLRLLADTSPQERHILAAFPYQINETVLHTDRRLLPRRRAAWAAWNYHLPVDPEQTTSVTYHMNRLQSLRAEREFCVTTNPGPELDESLVIRRVRYEHPLYTAASSLAQQQRHTINGVNRTYFCGAYWGTGFHEDGVNSGLAVAALLGQHL
ncbi:MAG TPA: FAD-dependent oxidoreductase [Candidatus Dormibacteraeota bacterium]